MKIAKNAQLAGLFVVLPENGFQWATRAELEDAVMQVSGFVVDEVAHPRKTLVVIDRKELGNAPGKRVKEALSRNVWVMTDDWLEMILAVGVPPRLEQESVYGVTVVDGRMRTSRGGCHIPLDCPRLPSNKDLIDAAFRYDEIHANRQEISF